MQFIEDRLRSLLGGDPIPANTREFATVRVPAGWLMEAVETIERLREEEDGRRRMLPSNLWY